MKQIKVKLDEDELAILDDLVKDIEISTNIKTTRTAVVKGAYEYGFLVMKESFGSSRLDSNEI